MRGPFRIGIDPGWRDTFEFLFDEPIRDLFESRDDIQWEMMEFPANNIATPDAIDRYDGVMIMEIGFSAASFEGVKRLACISRWGVGFDRIDIGAANAADVLVSLTPDAITRAVAEAQIALIFALAKELRSLDQRTRRGIWRLDSPVHGTDVAGKTLSSIGLGRIAAEMFKMARGIGFGRLLAVDPYCPQSRATELGVELVDLDTAMAEGDFVTVNALLDSTTRGMIGAREFALMKPTAYFVNTSRGPIVQESALVEALRTHRIAGAGLDVFEHEPPARDHPFFEMDHVIVSPHAMAWTKEGLAGLSRDACLNLVRVASGQVPPCLANPEAAQRPGVQAKLSHWRLV